MSEQLGEVDVWLVEDAVHRHPEWLKYPFRDGTATDFIYRFARTAQAEWLLAGAEAAGAYGSCRRARRRGASG